MFIEFDAEQKRALESSLTLARNQLEGEAFAADALLLGGLMASDKPGVSIFSEEQYRSIEKHSKDTHNQKM